jgi:hypothetical protein
VYIRPFDRAALLPWRCLATLCLLTQCCSHRGPCTAAVPYCNAVRKPRRLRSLQHALPSRAHWLCQLLATVCLRRLCTGHRMLRITRIVPLCRQSEAPCITPEHAPPVSVRPFDGLRSSDSASAFNVHRLSHELDSRPAARWTEATHSQPTIRLLFNEATEALDPAGLPVNERQNPLGIAVAGAGTPTVLCRKNTTSFCFSPCRFAAPRSLAPLSFVPSTSVLLSPSMRQHLESRGSLPVSVTAGPVLSQSIPRVESQARTAAALQGRWSFSPRHITATARPSNSAQVNTAPSIVDPSSVTDTRSADTTASHATAGSAALTADAAAGVSAGRSSRVRLGDEIDMASIQAQFAAMEAQMRAMHSTVERLQNQNFHLQRQVSRSSRSRDRDRPRSPLSPIAHPNVASGVTSTPGSAAKSPLSRPRSAHRRSSSKGGNSISDSPRRPRSASHSHSHSRSHSRADSRRPSKPEATATVSPLVGQPQGETVPALSSRLVVVHGARRDGTDVKESRDSLPQLSVDQAMAAGLTSPQAASTDDDDAAVSVMSAEQNAQGDHGAGESGNVSDSESNSDSATPSDWGSTATDDSDTNSSVMRAKQRLHRLQLRLSVSESGAGTPAPATASAPGFTSPPPMMPASATLSVSSPAASRTGQPVTLQSPAAARSKTQTPVPLRSPLPSPSMSGSEPVPAAGAATPSMPATASPQAPIQTGAGDGVTAKTLSSTDATVPLPSTVLDCIISAAGSEPHLVATDRDAAAAAAASTSASVNVETAPPPQTVAIQVPVTAAARPEMVTSPVPLSELETGTDLGTESGRQSRATAVASVGTVDEEMSFTPATPMLASFSARLQNVVSGAPTAGLQRPSALSRMSMAGDFSLALRSNSDGAVPPGSLQGIGALPSASNDMQPSFGQVQDNVARQRLLFDLHDKTMDPNASFEM